MIEAQRVDFIAVPTNDVARAEAFYGDVLGLEKNPNSLHDWIEFETGNVTLALVSAEGHGIGSRRCRTADCSSRAGRRGREGETRGRGRRVR